MLLIPLFKMKSGAKINNGRCINKTTMDFDNKTVYKLPEKHTLSAEFIRAIEDPQPKKNQ